jgi:hypothetical protein
VLGLGVAGAVEGFQEGELLLGVWGGERWGVCYLVGHFGLDCWLVWDMLCRMEDVGVNNIMYK